MLGTLFGGIWVRLIDLDFSVLAFFSIHAPGVLFVLFLSMLSIMSCRSGTSAFVLSDILVCVVSQAYLFLPHVFVALIFLLFWYITLLFILLRRGAGPSNTKIFRKHGASVGILLSYRGEDSRTCSPIAWRIALCVWCYDLMSCMVLQDHGATVISNPFLLSPLPMPVFGAVLSRRSWSGFHSRLRRFWCPSFRDRRA